MRKVFIALLIIITAVSCKDEQSELGDRYFQRGEYQKAVEAYTEYLKLEPTHIKSLYNRGRAYEELKQYDKALADFHKVVKEDPLNVNAYLSIASDYYYRQRDYQNTIFYAEKILNLNENSVTAHTLKGKAHQKLGDLQKAMSAYNAAISVNKNYPDAYLSRGLLRLHLKKNRLACADLRMASSLGSKSADNIVAKYCR